MKRPWLSYGMAIVAAYVLKLCYSRASAEDLSWILVPTARAVGWLRGETLTFIPGAGWVAPDGAYRIAPACAGVNFMILTFTLSVLGFAHRLRSPGARLLWWWASLGGAYLATIAVNTLRIVAAVELYRLGPVAGMSAGQAHRLLGTVLYLGAEGGLFLALDRLTARRAGIGGKGGGKGGRLSGCLLVAGAYLGLTVVVPLLSGHPGSRYAEHAVTVSLSTLLFVAIYCVLWKRRNLHGQTDDPGGRGRAGDCRHDSVRS
ncbi:MAG TPA: exosortase K [Thermoanaerobaculia bacterium]|nr:exosortase K [Thermoanaerobaculia bacterium]